MLRTVIKRDGSKQPYDPDKPNQWAEWAANDLDVDWSEIVVASVEGLPDNSTTQEIQDMLIRECIFKRTDAHSRLGARLLIGDIYKKVFHDDKPVSLMRFYNDMLTHDYWIDMGYSTDELRQFNNAIDHTRDTTYHYATVRQLYDKYAIKIDGEIKESPQFLMMGIAMANYRDDPNRVDQVIKFYHAVSLLKVNLPTPSLAAERTSIPTAPSCCVISGDDSVGSIGAATTIAYDMTAASAGIGAEYRTRAPKDPVKGGRIEHGGKYSYYNHLNTAVKANRQLVRGGSATVTIHCLDPEIERLLTLKKIRTDPEYKLPHMDYSFAVTELFLQKAAKNEEWMLVSPYYANDLWDISYSPSTEEFEAAYEKVRTDDSIPKKMVNARQLLMEWIVARGDTGRVYMTFLTNMNRHTPFYDSIVQSNLCLEIGLPTKPFNDVFELNETDVDGEIAVCNLGSVVVSRIESDEEYFEIAYLLTKFIDNTIERSVYPYKNLDHTAKKRRSIGVGMTDVAHYMAMHDCTFDSVEGRNLIHRLAELHSYALHTASVRLAKERGACEWMDRTRYSEEKPWLPVDTYAKHVDTYHTAENQFDWESLRGDIKQYGVRFSVLEAYMPVESSSVFTNSTNGVYPIRRKEMLKSSLFGMVYFRAPEYDELNYQSAYDVDHLELVKYYSIIQKFTGQSISADFFPSSENGKVSAKGMMQRVFSASKSGMKTFYYENKELKSGENVDAEITSLIDKSRSTVKPVKTAVVDNDCCTL